MAACYITVHWQCFRETFFVNIDLQKKRESQREIMGMHDFCASRSEP